MIESADGSEPIDPRALRELRDLLRTDEDLDLGVRLRDRQPAPGEQGAVPVAIEIITAAGPLGTAFATVLVAWLHTRKVRIKVRRGDDSVEISAPNVKDAEQLIAKLKS